MTIEATSQDLINSTGVLTSISTFGGLVYLTLILRQELKSCSEEKKELTTRIYDLLQRLADSRLK